MQSMKILCARSVRTRWPTPQWRNMLTVQTSSPNKMNPLTNEHPSSPTLLIGHLNSSCWTYFFVCTRTLPADLPSSIYCAPAPHSVASLHNSPSAMGTPMLTIEQNQIWVNISRGMTWPIGRVVVRLTKWSWCNVDDSWRNRPWQRMVHNSVAKAHAVSCVEFERIPPSESAAKMRQIQSRLLSK
jgi:hypothetical protein